MMLISSMTESSAETDEGTNTALQSKVKINKTKQKCILLMLIIIYDPPPQVKRLCGDRLKSESLQ